jgi:ABC-type multidrug transport system ATPase subunit
MTEPLAQSLAATRRFGNVVAVDAVHLEVRGGEVVGLLGANGAGKTTLIRMLLGLLPPSSGTILLFGQPPSRESRRRIGYLPQGLGLYEDLTSEENLAFAHGAFGVEDERLPASLTPVAHVLVGHLPLGIQRQVAFAQTLGHRPDLLMLDEPTSGVGPLARSQLWETIRATAESGVGVLVTTHHMDEAEQCDRLVVMAAGGVVGEGTVGEIVGAARIVAVESEDWVRAFDAIEEAGMSAALVGRSLRVPGASRAEVERALESVPATTVREAPATLEERFLQLSMADARNAGGARAPAASGSTASDGR